MLSPKPGLGRNLVCDLERIRVKKDFNFLISLGSSYTYIRRDVGIDA